MFIFRNALLVPKKLIALFGSKIKAKESSRETELEVIAIKCQLNL